MKYSVFLSVILCLFFFNLFSQDKLEGIYNSETKTFKTLDEIFNKQNVTSYTCGVYENNLSIVESVSKEENAKFTFNKNKTFGIIDTAGKVISPFNYSKIERLDNSTKNIFSYEKFGLFGMLNSKGEQITEFITTDITYIPLNWEYYAIIDDNNKIALFMKFLRS